MKRLLQLTMFFCGATVMAVELIGARMLTPLFGSSVHTWTAQISVTLLVLAAGYALGGRWADRAGPRQLYQVVALAGCFLLIVPLLQVPLLSFASRLGLRTGAVLGSALLFGPALLLLGAVTPLGVAVMIGPGRTAGRTAGSLYALSTAGSLLGALLSGFVLAAVAGNRAIIAGCAVLLLALSGIYFSKRGVGLDRGALLLAFVPPLLPIMAKSPRILEANGVRLETIARAPSVYGTLHVIDRFRVDSGGEAMPVDRGLYREGVCQTLVDWNPHESRLLFPYSLRSLVSLYQPAPDTLLCIGVGAGALPMDFARRGTTVDAVEIDPVVVGFARRYFDYGHERIQTITADGRSFLLRTSKRYDAIVLDAFGGGRVPAHLLTRQMFALVRQHLSEGGVFAMNFIAATDQPDGPSLRAVYATLKAEFETVFAFAEPKSEIMNVYFLAACGPAPSNPQAKIDGIPTRLSAALEKLGRTPLMLSEEPSLVLTDDRNPIELLNHAATEKLRHSIAASGAIKLFL